MYLGPNLTISRPRNIWKLENTLSNQIKNYLLTEPLKDMFKNIANFLRQKPTQSQSVHFKLENKNKSRLDSNNENESGSSSTEDNEQSEDYVEILKLRHINLTK